MKINIKLNETIDKESGFVMNIDPKVEFKMEKGDGYDTEVLEAFELILERLTYDYLCLAGYVADSRAEKEGEDC